MGPAANISVPAMGQDSGKNNTMKYGDTVAFRLVINDGMGLNSTFLTAEARAEPQVTFQQLDGRYKVPPGASKCTFQLCQRFQYNSQQALQDELMSFGISLGQWRKMKDFLGPDGTIVGTNEAKNLVAEILGGSVTAEKLPGRGQSTESLLNSLRQPLPGQVVTLPQHLLRLERAAEDEMMLNDAELKRNIGDPVIFSQVVQLRHEDSGGFLTQRKEGAAVDKGALKISIDPAGGQGSWFRILPVHHTDREGDEVSYGDIPPHHGGASGPALPL
mmetsp:Transcript_64875/g.204909  ORF Transcript_64875/g.204909 Transcript_64875/m.204909 type:complete len:274 (+) Transcript_64875:249-1070(+)